MATRGLGACARQGAGVYPCARSERRRVGDHSGADIREFPRHPCEWWSGRASLEASSLRRPRPGCGTGRVGGGRRPAWPSGHAALSRHTAKRITPGARPPRTKTHRLRHMTLECRVKRLQATVQQLTERLQQDSRTSARPPSSNPSQAFGKRPQREPSGRRPGGQPDHEGQTRVLVPIEQVDVVIPVKPEQCSRYQHLLYGEDGQPPPRP
jgi:hypothetical protein